MAAQDDSASTWQDSVTSWGTTVLQGGVDILKAKSDAKAVEQNQPVKPSDNGGIPKVALYIGIGIIGLLVVLVAVKRR